MELREPTLFAPLPTTCPAELAKRAAAWSTKTRELLAEIAAAETAMARRAKALKAGTLPVADDRRSPKAYGAALEALQEHLATLGPLRDAVAEALAKVLAQAQAAATKTVANLAGRLVTLGYSEEDARGMAARHPDALALVGAAGQADSQLCSLPNPAAGSCLHLAVEVDNRLAALEAR